jgi:glutathione peroxidase
MKRFIRLLAALLFPSLPCAHIAAADSAPLLPTLYDYIVKDIDGKEVVLSAYRGKVALVVNTASNCGFTYQYKDLEALFQRFKEKGFVVLGFPSNDFGGQEPGKNEEIKAFCESTYKTTFPIFEKAPVSGSERQPVYRFLTEASAKEFQGDPGWNFVKFLVNKEGKVVGRFSSMDSPTGNSIVAAIESQL